MSKTLSKTPDPNLVCGYALNPVTPDFETAFKQLDSNFQFCRGYLEHFFGRKNSKCAGMSFAQKRDGAILQINSEICRNDSARAIFTTFVFVCDAGMLQVLLSWKTTTFKKAAHAQLDRLFLGNGWDLYLACAAKYVEYLTFDVCGPMARKGVNR